MPQSVKRALPKQKRLLKASVKIMVTKKPLSKLLKSLKDRITSHFAEL